MGKTANFSFYEFFAGGGMARAGLGKAWACLFTNDFDQKKGETYAANWGAKAQRIDDIRKVKADCLPEVADLAWASFPCQDLSLAGGGAGLRGERSGTFWPFWKLIQSLLKEGRGPRMIALENVCGALTSHGGKDFAAICDALSKANYRFGALVVDAAYFVPQSRPRLFFLACREDIEIPESLLLQGKFQPWHTTALRKAHDGLSSQTKKNWLWFSLPIPTKAAPSLSELIEDDPSDVPWHNDEETQKLLSMMSDLNKAKVENAKLAGKRVVGTIYKRTRPNDGGLKIQRAEVRFDDVSGCLRTPAGGSSRQVVMIVEGNRVRSRLISARETARLMGLPDTYQLPSRYNEAYHLTGDGVVVPVVRHLAKNIMEPILSNQTYCLSTVEAA